MLTIEKCKTALEAGETTSEQIVRQCFEKIEQDQGQGSTVFTVLYKERAINQAIEFDKRKSAGAPLPSYAGIPISVKDLFDIEGRPTTAGSVILKGAPAATSDAPVVQRLRQAGLIIMGSTNMTEFAYSGLGLNPHYGTPLNPYDRDSGRIPGGSSSGAAISVTDGFAAMGLGTDTGGSCRIPAALCGIVGFKPTQKRVPLTGTIPLSHSLDSIGPLAATVKSCAIIDSIISGEDDNPLPKISVEGLKLAVPVKPMLDHVDDHVGRAFERCLTLLSRHGAMITEIELKALSDIPHLNKNGGLAAAEAYAWHKEMLETRFDQYDPRVGTRIMNWLGSTDDDYKALLQARKETILSANEETIGYDALICPTVPTIAPTVKSLENDEEYIWQNFLMLKNPSLFNFLDRCSISIPCHEAGTAPVGLMISGEHGSDRKLLAIAERIELAIASLP